MVHLWSMLASGETWLSSHALRAPPVPPSTTSWITYARCHDDIGWAIGDEDAAAAGRSGSLHRRFLADFYDATFPGPGPGAWPSSTTPRPATSGPQGRWPPWPGLESGDPLGLARVLLGCTP